MQRAVDAGHKKQSAMFRFKGMYFVMPSSRIISEADGFERAYVPFYIYSSLLTRFTWRPIVSACRNSPIACAT